MKPKEFDDTTRYLGSDGADSVIFDPISEAVDRAISSGVKRGLNRLIKTAIFHINFGGRIYVDISGLAVCVDLVKLVRETVKEETDHELLSDLRSALQNALKLMD